MNDKIEFNTLLVPTDFSENAWAAFQHALALADQDDSEIIVMHVIDSALIDQMVDLVATDHETIFDSIKTTALKRFADYANCGNENTNIDTLVCDGEPFLEIVRKADDFAVDAIIMSRLGQRAQGTSLLFGSTAEKVIRASNKPVIVLPTRYGETAAQGESLAAENRITP